MKNRAQGVARGSALIVTGVAALVLGIGSPAFAGDPDHNGDVHSNCHTGSKGLGAGGEDTHGPNAEGDNCQGETPQPPPPPPCQCPPGQPPMQPGQPVKPGQPAAQVPVTVAVPAQVSAVTAGPIPTAVEAGQHTTDSWTVPLGAALVTLGAAGSGAALVARRRTAQR